MGFWSLLLLISAALRNVLLLFTRSPVAHWAEDSRKLHRFQFVQQVILGIILDWNIAWFVNKLEMLFVTFLITFRRC